MIEKDREILILHRLDRLDRLDEAIKDVSFLIENDRLHIAVNRIYYCIFYLISALALKHEFETSKHLQLIGWFNKEFIKSGKVDRKFGQYVHEAFDKRSKGDYDDFTVFTSEEVVGLYSLLKEFNDVIRGLLPQ